MQDRHEIVAINRQLKISARFNLNALAAHGSGPHDARVGELYVAVRFAVLVNAENGTEINRVPAAAGVDRLWLDPENERCMPPAADLCS